MLGYMCMIDWQHEIGAASDGNKVYPSIEDLRRDHTMFEQCGVVEVRISFSKIMIPQDLRRK